MISALFPGMLAAGAALAVAPILLHLLARRPPDREPLPTARFLREDARTVLRLQRRPTDRVLLAVRVLFALTLGAAFAGMTWTPSRTGTGRIVLLDAGADPRSDWDDVRATARRGVADTPNVSPGGGAIILAYGLDDGYRLVSPEDLDGLLRGTRSATAEDGLRALRDGVLTMTRWQSADVVWVMRPSWRAWNQGVGLLRPAVWPGRVALRPVIDETFATGDPAPLAVDTPTATTALAPTAVPAPIAVPVRTTAFVPNVTAGDPLLRALAALGVTAAVAAPPSRPDWIFLEAPGSEEIAGMLLEAGAGATLVVSGRLGNDSAAGPSTHDASAIPWTQGAAEKADRGGVVLATGLALAPPVAEGGSPAPGAHVIASFEDATPAAVAVTSGSGCVVYLAASIHDPALVGSPEYPSLVNALGGACARIEGLDGPLDRGALQALERSDLPTHVDLRELAASEGLPLGRWLVFLTLALLLAEVGLTRVRRP